jgi:hypothetical protein
MACGDPVYGTQQTFLAVMSSRATADLLWMPRLEGRAAPDEHAWCLDVERARWFSIAQASGPT